MAAPDLEEVFAWVSTIDASFVAPPAIVDNNVNRHARILLDSTFVAEQVLDSTDFSVENARQVEELMDFLKRPFRWGPLDIDIAEALHFRRACVGYYFAVNNKDFRFAGPAFESFLGLFDYRAKDEYTGNVECIDLAKVGFFSDAHVIAHLHFCELVILCARKDYKDRATIILKAFTEACAPGTPLHGAGWTTDRTDELMRLVDKL
eukprot:GEMP01063559.1.p1 GENE.GEMP01063559.1~~GEMP01063559.1.p1  ORF type:complete len:206 (+),score=50.68 GEMP01063559.1:134-751(+)